MPESTNVWNGIFKNQGKVFTEPHEDMPGIVAALKRIEAKTILDLGSGSGRHVIYLAQNGFRIFGLDNSPEGINLTEKWMSSEKVSANIQFQNMEDLLPYGDAFFDGVISVQVIHHAKIETIRKIIGEITRVLKRKGLLFVTVPTTNHHHKYKEIETNTIIPLDGPEKGLLHHYFTPEELREEFKDFENISLHIDSVDHYCLFAAKR